VTDAESKSSWGELEDVRGRLGDGLRSHLRGRPEKMSEDAKFALGYWSRAERVK